jgi:peptidoglycan L-alanyl-D-glutamate endopeptidase CwlK
VAEAAGLRWGGRWTMMDFGHVELQQAGLLRSAAGHSLF